MNLNVNEDVGEDVGDTCPDVDKGKVESTNDKYCAISLNEVSNNVFSMCCAVVGVLTCAAAHSLAAERPNNKSM